MILRASSLNPFASATLRVASECQKLSKPEAGEASSARSMNKATSLRNMFQSPADRLEQHQCGLPMAPTTALFVKDISERRDQMFCIHAGSQRGSAGRTVSLRVSRMCYTILFKHIPSKKACSFPK